MKRRLKELSDGFLLAWQFYTTVPVRKQIPVDARRLKFAFYTLPIIGMCIGLVIASLLMLNETFLHLPATMVALIILTVPIFITGGLHLDGWMDMSDALFSYRDKEKRLEIMSDPRTGSFAVLSVLFLLAWRYVLIFETLQLANLSTYLLIISIYFFARISMCYVFIQGKLAKQEGLAAYFKQGINRNDFSFFFISAFLWLLIIAYIDLASAFYAFITFLISIVFAILFLRLLNKQFGGLTGDTLGAALEGSETCLWMTVWLLHSFVMGLL